MDLASGARPRLPPRAGRSARPHCPQPAVAPAMPQPGPITRLLLPPPGLNQHHATLSGLTRAFATSTASLLHAPGPLDGWMLTLERGIGKAYGAEEELQATGAFRGEVFPDLPIATTWQNLAKALNGRLRASTAAAADDDDPAPPFTHYTTRPGALKVTTVAANLRTEHEIEMRVVAAAGDGAEATGGQRANALLCVSGSHPVRTLPLVSRFLRSSLDTLRIAQRLRQQGYIPPATQLWVVANPNTEPSAALLEAKASLGANAVLTQPPFDWPAYLAWLGDAERRGLLRPAPPPSLPFAAARAAPPVPEVSTQASSLQDPSSAAVSVQAGAQTRQQSGTSSADTSSGGGSRSSSDGGGSASDAPLRLLVGQPMLSSAANLSFWVSLSGCGGSPAAQRLLAEAARAEMEGRETAARFFEAYNRRLVGQVLERGGVAGLHVMPITKASKRMVLAMLADGSLPPSSSSPSTD